MARRDAGIHRSGRIALVTGANGFIGRHACRALVERGWRVRALARCPIDGLTQKLDYLPVRGVDDRAAIRSAMEGVEVVVHLAGRAHHLTERAADPPAEFRRVNVEGTRVILEEAVRAGVRHLTYASSIAVVGPVDGACIRAETPTAPLTSYGQSKLEAEKLITEVSAHHRISATLVRPTLVYGPGMKGNPLRLFDFISSGCPLPFGLLDNKKSFLFVGNLIAAICKTLDEQRPGVSVLLAGDRETFSTREFSLEIARALGMTPRLLPVPPAALSVLGRIGDVWSRWPLNRDVVERLSSPLVIDTTAMEQLLDGAYPFTTREGLELTAAWYRQRARLGPPESLSAP